MGFLPFDIAFAFTLPARLFKGVQGQKEKQGELFGIKNMLTLRRDLTTKETIEDAHIGNLEWALANTELGADGDDVSLALLYIRSTADTV